MMLTAPAPSYTSTKTTLAASQSYTIPHSLGVVPKKIAVVFECQTAEGGFSIGDQCMIMSAYSQPVIFQQCDQTNLLLTTPAVFTNLMMQKGSVLLFTPTAANWKWFVQATL